MVGRCVAEKLEIVGRVLVVGGNKQSHHPMQECLAGRVVREQSVPEERNYIHVLYKQYYELLAQHAQTC